MKKIQFFSDAFPGNTQVLPKTCQYQKFPGKKTGPSKRRKLEKLDVAEFHKRKLCQRRLYKHPQSPCGKPLWKTLWKMWKSSGFPQTNRGFANSAPGNSVHKSLHKPIHNAKTTMLRNHPENGNRLSKPSKKVAFSDKLSFSKGLWVGKP